MTKKRKTNFPKWTGSIRTPIDTGVLPLDYAPQEKWDYLADAMVKNLRDGREKKLFELGRQLGIAPPPEADCVEKLFRLGLFYQMLATDLAVRAGIPGFQAKRSAKWPDNIVCTALLCCEISRENLGSTDLDTCIGMVKALHPDLAKRKNARAAAKAARQLCNKVSATRTRMTRLAGGKKINFIEFFRANASEAPFTS